MGTVELIAQLITGITPNTSLMKIYPSCSNCCTKCRLLSAYAVPITRLIWLQLSEYRTIMKDNRLYLLYGSGVGKAAANSALGARAMYPVRQGSQNA